MKFFGILIGLTMVALGIVLSNSSTVLRAVLIIAGVFLALAVWLRNVIKNHAVVCPECGAKYTWKLPIALKQHNGTYPCPRCGTLIRLS